jgi:hypothetical protein
LISPKIHLLVKISAIKYIIISSRYNKQKNK